MVRLAGDGAGGKRARADSVSRVIVTAFDLPGKGSEVGTVGSPDRRSCIDAGIRRTARPGRNLAALSLTCALLFVKQHNLGACHDHRDHPQPDKSNLERLLVGRRFEPALGH